MKTNKARKTVFTSISVLALVLMTVVFGISLHAQTIIIGDMNNDSVVNEDDAAYLLRHVLLPSKYPIDQSGDLNGDGKVDVDDALYLSKHITSPDEYPLTCHHDFGEWTQTKAPTCTEKGEEKRTCNNCGSSETRDVAALGHEYVDGVCKNCGQEIQPSEGLEYTLNSDDESYYVSGIGSCKDTDIVIPSTYNGMPVTGIGSNAFENCSSLTSIEIPDSVTSIGGEAFEYCSSLTSIKIPDSVTSIGYGAFEYCSSLTSIKIPDSVTSIGYGAFAGTAYYNNNDNWVDGVLYIGNHLIEAKSYTLSANYTIKSGTKCIADGAFSGCDSLTSITIPDSVTSIGYDAFRYCSSLTSIKIPDSVTSIGWYAFYDTAYYNNNDNWIDGVLYIGNHLIKAKPDTLPADYTIKSGTKCIADDAFSHCSSLTSITIPNSVTSIGDQAFEYCSSLTSVTIGNSVTSIGNSAFYGCSSLTSITIPDSVTSIGNGAFYHCSSLTSITIPDSVTIIGRRAFAYCSSLTSINIPDSVTSIGGYAFYHCSSLESITVVSGNPVYHSAGNCLIKTSSKTLVAGCKNSIIPTDGSVTSIGGSAFEGCSSLKSITIPYSVTGIGDKAFWYCSSLTSVTIGDSVTSIGSYAFYNCSSLTSITIPYSVTGIGDKAFWYCSSLTSINFNGTKAQWNTISKGTDWNYNTGSYKIYCTDGTISK